MAITYLWWIEGICLGHLDLQDELAALVGRVRRTGDLAAQLRPTVIDQFDFDGTLDDLFREGLQAKLTNQWGQCLHFTKKTEPISAPKTPPTFADTLPRPLHHDQGRWCSWHCRGAV